VGEPPVLTDEELLAAEPSADARERMAQLIRHSRSGRWGTWDGAIELLARHYDHIDSAPLVSELYGALLDYSVDDGLNELLPRLSIVYLFHGIVSHRSTEILADRDLWAGDFDPEAREYDGDPDRVLHLRPSADAPRTFCGLDCSQLYGTERGAWMDAGSEADGYGFLSEQCGECNRHAREVPDVAYEEAAFIPFGSEGTRAPLEARYRAAIDDALRRGLGELDTQWLWAMAVGTLAGGELPRAADAGAAGGAAVIRRALGDRLQELPPALREDDVLARALDPGAWRGLMERFGEGIIQDEVAGRWMRQEPGWPRHGFRDELLERIEAER
jgi:hypothetical protein